MKPRRDKFEEINFTRNGALMSQNDRKSVLRLLWEKIFFYENTNSNMFSGNFINLRKKFHANRM